VTSNDLRQWDFLVGSMVIQQFDANNIGLRCLWMLLVKVLTRIIRNHNTTFVVFAGSAFDQAADLLPAKQPGAAVTSRKSIRRLSYLGWINQLAGKRWQYQHRHVITCYKSK